MTEKDGFNVVFEGKGDGKGNHKGIRTWTSFNGPDDLSDFLEKTGNSDTVIAQSVSDEEAVKLTGETTTQAYLNSFLIEATSPDGQINRRQLIDSLRGLELLRPEKVSKHRRGN